jgi:hypothetical protein
MTAKTKTQRLKRLISHGFFAPELPPCFVSDDLARYRKACGLPSKAYRLRLKDAFQVQSNIFLNPLGFISQDTEGMTESMR